MWYVVAAAAVILVLGLFALVRGVRRDTHVRRASIGRPEYPRNNHAAVTEWRVACNKSLTWSRKRRNKENV